MSEVRFTAAPGAAELAAYARRRARQRTNLRLLFVAAFVGISAFCAGYASAPRAADAITWHLVAHGLSHHSGSRTDRVATVQTVTSDRRTPDASPRLRLVETDVQVPYQERNWGLGLRADLAPTVSAQAGLYRNSYDRTSLYALADWTPLRAGPAHAQLQAGGFAGVVTGYPYSGGRLSAAGGLLLRAQADRLSLALRAVPKLSSKQSGHTVTLEAGWRI
jgi:hypothetical protein